MNMNDFARDVTLQEGGKVNLSIAQVKEVIRIVLTNLACLDTIEVEAILRRYEKKRKRRKRTTTDTSW